MGQLEVYNLLKEKGWMTKSEISEILADFSIASINSCLRRLVKSNFIEIKKDPTKKHAYLYRMVKDENNK